METALKKPAKMGIAGVTDGCANLCNRHGMIQQQCSGFVQANALQVAGNGLIGALAEQRAQIGRRDVKDFRQAGQRNIFGIVLLNIFLYPVG